MREQKMTKIGTPTDKPGVVLPGIMGWACPSSDIPRRRGKNGFTPLETGRRRRPTVASGNLSLTGFTLVETLIVVALFAVIGVSLLQSFVMGLKVWKAATSPNYSYRKAVIGLERLSSELRQIVNYPTIGFWGERDTCTFANIARDKVYNITYNYSGEDNVFYRTAVSLQELAGQSPASPRRKIIPGVKNFSFSFYGYDNTTGNATFLDSWNYTKSSIPLAVKVACTVEDGREFEKVITIPISQ